MEDPFNIKPYVENLKKMDIDRESRDLILGGNACRLFGL
jgi:hypothetical protein